MCQLPLPAQNEARSHLVRYVFLSFSFCLVKLIFVLVSISYVHLISVLLYCKAKVFVVFVFRCR